MTVRGKAPAKLNLTLSVSPGEGGYHEIDSLVCSIDIADSVVVSSRRDDKVNIIMHGLGSESIEYEDNNAVKAALLFQKTFGTRGVDITVYKNIPMGAGLGGSSADAASVLKCMQKLYKSGTDEEVKGLADTLGSDTGYMTYGGFARITGRGEKVERLDIPKKRALDIVLLLPKTGVNTRDAYRLSDLYNDSKNPNRTPEAIQALADGDTAALGGSMYNDLLRAAEYLNPEVAKARKELESFAPLGVNMTGSGSAVFAVFENDMFCEWAKSRYRGRYSCVRTRTIPGKPAEQEE
ncbi:MAG: 4-(cytidine 5'-diphospho)-2-C-methyl-D-erythritol kinase [Clostridia bacterium]|nr:4-(cytidine 5'-diphospho)-2-C-methyl-D-erythritol kinase [Clostridia bacterium]